MAEINSAGGNLSKVARALGLDYYALKSRTSAAFRPATQAAAAEPADFRDLARPSLRPFAIAARQLGTEWPKKHQAAIERGRALYDAGTHEMCQGHHQGWCVLYLIPRLVPTRQRTYFSEMAVGF